MANGPMADVLPRTATGHRPSDDDASANGVRAVYLNELGRSEAERLGVAIAARVWEQHHRRGRDEDELPTPGEPVASGPEVVVARDGRPSSPDMACGVVRGLKRMCCHVIDLGAVSRPSVDFAVYHLRAAAGIMVTGAGGSGATTGVDVVGADGVPWSRPGRLDQISEWRNETVSRPSRQGGRMRTFDAAPSERADFQRQLHGLRHCRVGVIADDALQREQLTGWFASSVSDVVPLAALPLPFGVRELPAEVRRRLRATLQAEHLRCVVRIGDDGRCVQLFDEHGRPVDPADWLPRVAERLAARAGSGRLVVGSNLSAVARGRLKAHGTEVTTVAPTHEALVTRLVETRGLLAADGLGRIWFADHYPLCHGFVTLAHLMRLAIELGQPVSHWGA